MTYDQQEASLKHAAEFGIMALRSRAAEVMILAQRAQKEGNEGMAASYVRIAADIQADVAEMEKAYLTKYPRSAQ